MDTKQQQLIFKNNWQNCLKMKNIYKKNKIYKKKIELFII